MLLFIISVLASTNIIVEGSLFENGEGLGDLADAFGQLFNEMEDCVYKCPNEVKPKPNPDHIPTSNGCGAYGVKVESDMVPGMTKCCNKHDLCYDKCGSTKKSCDKEFKECLDVICDKSKKTMSKKAYSGCKSTAKILYGGTSMLGCDAFLSSQKKACRCGNSSGGTKRVKRSEL